MGETPDAPARAARDRDGMTITQQVSIAAGLRASGFALRYPTYREGYQEQLRLDGELPPGE